MTHETLINEKRYLICLSLIRRMREKGLLSDAEYTQARRLILDQHKPKISVLFE